MILLDTSGLLSAVAAGQRHHGACLEALTRARPPLVLSPFVLAELDYRLGTHIGHAEQLALLDEVAHGVYTLDRFGPADVGVAREVMERYADLEIGLADSSLVLLAHRHGTRDVLTLDERHFRAPRTVDRKPFRLLPADSS